MTLKTTFKKIYSELLSEYGYKYCTKLDCFVKVVNEEFIHCIGFTSKGYIAYTSGNKAFSVTGIVLSLYYPFIDNYEKTELKAISSHLYFYGTPSDIVYGFEYNEETMEIALKKSFTYVEKYMLPVMEKAVDYDSYINYQIRIHQGLFNFANEFKNDSLLLIVADNHDDFMSVVEENFYRQPKEAQTQLSYDGMKRVMTDFITKPRDEVFNNPELLSKALAEAERRKEHNIELLKLYKVI